MASPVRVVITANSALGAAQIKSDLSLDGSLQITTAVTVDQLRLELKHARPQVVLLDTQLTGEGTPDLVAELTYKQNVPVILRSDMGSILQSKLLDSLNAGALVVLEKPTSSDLVAAHIPALIWSIKAAAHAIPMRRSMDQFHTLGNTTATALLAIGAGMGSLPALEGILSQLPGNSPGAVVIPPISVATIIELWVGRMNRPGRVQLKVATNGDRIQSGVILVAPATAHLMIGRSALGPVVNIKNGPDVFHQKPSIDVMFDSIARLPGFNAVGVLLGGAGVDGVSGLKNLKNAGGHTIAESATTSVLGDAPNRAIKCGAVDAVEPADKIAAKMMEFASRNSLQAA